MDTALAKLRPFNLIAGLLHLASLVAIVLLANDASLPVKATYMTNAPGTGEFSDPVTLFDVNIGWAIAAFLALSAFFHFMVISPRMLVSAMAATSVLRPAASAVSSTHTMLLRVQSM